MEILLKGAYILKELRDLNLVPYLVCVLGGEIDSLFIDDETCIYRVDAEVALDDKRHDDQAAPCDEI